MAIKMSNLALNMLLAVAGGEEPQPVLDNIITYKSGGQIPNSQTWVAKYTYTDYNEYDSETKNGILYVKPTCHTIGGEFQSPFYSVTNVTDVDLARCKSINNIGANAFRSCTALERLTINAECTKFFTGAFLGCYSLKKVRYHCEDFSKWCTLYFENPDANPLYNGAELQDINKIAQKDFDVKSTYISNYAFYNCTSIESVIFSAATTDIGSDAFRGCSNIKGVVWQSAYDKWLCINFTNVFSNPCVLAKTAPKFKMGDVDITSPSLPKTQTDIKPYAFAGWGTITTIKWNNKSNITKIDKGAFYNCFAMNNVVLPKKLTEIGKSIFEGCNAIVSINTPFIGRSRTPLANSEESLLGYWFGNAQYDTCEKIYQPYEIYNGNLEFYYYYIPKSLQSIYVSDATSIGFGAFHECQMLKSVEFGKSLTTISDYAFGGCKRLTNISLPDTLTYIGTSAFDTSKYQNIPYGTTEVNCYAQVPPTLGNSNFTNDNDTLHVEESCLQAYKSDATWNSAFTKIVEIK